MSQIKVQHDPSADLLKQLGVRQWAIWEKEISEFPWHYDEQEMCYFLAGEVVVVPDGSHVHCQICAHFSATSRPTIRSRWCNRKR